MKRAFWNLFVEAVVLKSTYMLAVCQCYSEYFWGPIDGVKRYTVFFLGRLQICCISQNKVIYSRIQRIIFKGLYNPHFKNVGFVEIELCHNDVCGFTAFKWNVNDPGNPSHGCEIWNNSVRFLCPIDEEGTEQQWVHHSGDCRKCSYWKLCLKNVSLRW